MSPMLWTAAGAVSMLQAHTIPITPATARSKPRHTSDVAT
jgi:hypothetical protein